MAGSSSRLLPLHRGVYAVGHKRLTQRGRWMAAVLAVPGGLLSHRSAGTLWAIVTSSYRPEVLTDRRTRPQQGLRLRHTRAIDPADRAVRDGIPVTSVARTLLGLAAVLDQSRLDRAVEAAERLDLFDLPPILELLERHPRRPGATRLRRSIALYRPMPFTRSELEEAFVALVRRAGLPEPAMNAWVEGYEVDALWPRHRLVVELDSFEFHRTRAAFERDRRRDADLGLAGHEVVRLTWRRVLNEPAEVAALLRRRMGAAATRTGARAASPSGGRRPRGGGAPGGPRR